MKGFMLLLLSHRVAAESCEDSSCVAEETTLLQGLHQQVVSRQIQSSPGLLNHNQQCWHAHQCNRLGGDCPSFCGTGRCCRLGHVYSDGEREECGEGGFGLPNMHTCQPPAELLNHNQQCWHRDQCNRQGGNCPSFCGAGRCCRSGHVYSKRERAECGSGGFGLRNMHTCQPLPATVPNIQNPDFETGFTTNNYEYTRDISGWTAAGGTVAVRTGNRPWGGIAANSGNYLLALQSTGASVKQDVSGFMVGSQYKLTVYAAQRGTTSPGGSNAPLRVVINGRERMNSVISSTSMSAQEVTFTAHRSTIEIMLENAVSSADQTVFIDDLEITEV